MAEKKSEEDINLENLRLHSNGLTSNLHSTLPLSREIVDIELKSKDRLYSFDIFLVYKSNDNLDRFEVGHGNMAPRGESSIELNCNRNLPYSPQIFMQLPDVFRRFGYKIKSS